MAFLPAFLGVSGEADPPPALWGGGPVAPCWGKQMGLASAHQAQQPASAAAPPPWSPGGLGLLESVSCGTALTPGGRGRGCAALGLASFCPRRSWTEGTSQFQLFFPFFCFLLLARPC